MDKTLEIVMVAVALVVAAVIVISLLQGRADSLGGFADNKTTSAGCGISEQQFCNSLDGNELTQRSVDIADNNQGCGWAPSSPSAGNTYGSC